MTFDIGKGVTCDLSVLIDTRLLVQANSGGGKSWCLRRLLEQTHGHVQHLVIDPEGEFASLREKFDYVLAAKAGGDTAADPRSAKLLAERLLELGVSAILDIYELKAHERIKFVRQFLEALVDAPKKLWHPALVVVDEAHVYCPQKGEAESAGAVIDLATRGRKRGFCQVLATQRLSKLHKDAAAECNNKLIGRTALDVDIDRASDELGFGAREQKQTLRQLAPGEFFAFGPAVGGQVSRTKVGTVQTKHPKAGARIAFTAPPPTSKVKALLPKLADLPAEAEERQRTLADLQKELATTKRELTLARKGVPAAAAPARETRVEVPVEVLTDGDRELLRKLGERMEAAVDAIATRADVTLSSLAERAKADIDASSGRWVAEAARARAAFLEQVERTSVQRILGKLARVAAAPAIQATPRRGEAAPRSGHAQAAAAPPAPRPRVNADVAGKVEDAEGGGSSTAPVAQRILDALAELEVLGVPRPERVQVAFLSGYAHLRSKGFQNAIGALRSSGLVTYPSQGTMALTDAGRARTVMPERPRTPAELHARVLQLLGGKDGQVLQELLQAYPAPMPRGELAAATGYGHERSKGFQNAIGRLRSLGLIDYPETGQVVARSLLFLEGAA